MLRDSLPRLGPMIPPRRHFPPRRLAAWALLVGHALLGPALLPGSVHAAEPPPDRAQFSADALAFFEKKVRPLLHQHCYECHSQEADKQMGGLRLDHHASLFGGGDSGPAVVADKPEESLLIDAVRYGPDSYQMPPSGKLAAEDVETLEAWVRMGAPFPPSDEGTAIATGGIDFEAGRRFWSFQPLASGVPPGVEESPRNRSERTFAERKATIAGDLPERKATNRIDAFILAALEAEGLTPSPPADRHTLIRRLSFDITGLPPSADEVERFVADDAPDAYERLVDRLLASPAAAQRWARLWLDLARYTDTTESWLESTGQAHLYRDWVVDAFAQDMPYDQFVMRQLATDMMSSTGPEDMPALGFLGLSPTYWKELLLPPEIIRVIVADEWEERVDAVSQTFLGLTVACARCHDHKFDPISTEDYHALAGVIASVRMTERPTIPEEQYDLVQCVKVEVESLRSRIQEIRERKPPVEEAERQVAELQARIEGLRAATPGYDAPLANALDDQSLEVVRAGENSQSGTRLEYRPGPTDLPIFIRGNPNQHGPVVPRRFLTVLSEGPPEPFTIGSGRLELARHLVEDAQPLVARVIVNRIWQALFGRGLVDTPSNFGVQGARPTHPELLDDLASRFVARGWSIRSLQREIVLSATYRQSSAAEEENLRRDPDNRFLWRMNRRRLEIEPWRDAMLSAAGELDRRFGGPAQSLEETGNRRRTLYGTVHRREPSDVLRLHDFPDANAHSPRRVSTMTPLQGLFVLNSPLVFHWAGALAQRARRESPHDLDQQIAAAYRMALGRWPSVDELHWGREFLTAAGGEAADQAWPQYAQALLGSNEFLFVD